MLFSMFSMLASGIPSLLVVIAGGVYALVKRPLAPMASNLVLVAVALDLFSRFMTAIFWGALSRSFGASSLGSMSGVFSFGMSIVHAVETGLLIAAAFVGREGLPLPASGGGTGPNPYAGQYPGGAYPQGGGGMPSGGPPVPPGYTPPPY